MDPAHRLPLPLRLGATAWLALARRCPPVARAVRASSGGGVWAPRFARYPDWRKLAAALRDAAPQTDDGARLAAAAEAAHDRDFWRRLLAPNLAEALAPRPTNMVEFTPSLRRRLLRHARTRALNQRAERDRRRLALALANTPGELAALAARAAERELRQLIAAWCAGTGWHADRIVAATSAEFEAQALPPAFRHAQFVDGTRGQAILYGVRPARLPAGLAAALAAGCRRCVRRLRPPAPIDHEARLAEALRSAIGEFSAGAGHEINNPLAAILGEAQLLLADETDPPRRERLRHIAEHARRVHRMIRDLHFIGGAHRAEQEPVALTDAFARGIAAAATVPVGALTMGDLPAAAWVQGDAALLERLCSELLRNAAAAAGPRGWARIDAEQLPGAWRLRVTDSGPGFTAEARRHVLTPYYSGRSAGRGLGMGLPVVARIVADHGGRWTILPSRPTTIVIDLPAAITAAARRAA